MTCPKENFAPISQRAAEPLGRVGIALLCRSAGKIDWSTHNRRTKRRLRSVTNVANNCPAVHFQTADGKTDRNEKWHARNANLHILATNASEASINLIVLQPCGRIVTESSSAPHAESIDDIPLGCLQIVFTDWVSREHRIWNHFKSAYPLSGVPSSMSQKWLHIQQPNLLVADPHSQHALSAKN